MKKCVFELGLSDAFTVINLIEMVYKSGLVDGLIIPSDLYLRLRVAISDYSNSDEV